MALRKWIQLLLHGERRSVPRLPLVHEVENRRRTVIQRLNKLEADLEVHVGKSSHQ